MEEYKIERAFLRANVIHKFEMVTNLNGIEFELADLLSKYQAYLLRENTKTSTMDSKLDVKVIRLTEMSGDHFDQIFEVNFAPKFKKETIAGFKSLHGFHKAIADYGLFDSHRRAIELGYDVEFTLDQPEWIREQSQII